MARKTSSHKSKSKAKPKGYLLIYFWCIIIAFAAFVGTSYFLELHPPCANSKTCQSDLSESVDNKSIGIFQGHEVVPPKIDTTAYLNYSNTSVLGVKDPDKEKHIYVDLSTQKLYAYDGTEEFMETYIASGRWGRTPVGNFHIWSKLGSTRMSGGSGADYYNLPNVPNVMYFYHDFGLHGAYWHNNFGHTMSHGCVNMRLVDAKTLFEWADSPAKGELGTAVSICDSFTGPNNCVQKDPIN